MSIPKVVKNATILFPFILVFLSEILKISYDEISTMLKILSVFYMIVYSVLNLRYPIEFVFFLLLFTPFFIYGIFHSFDINAAISEGIRYLFPISVLLYSYAIRSHYSLLLKSLILFVLVNDFVQIINYINWMRGIDQWFYNSYSDGTRYFNITSGIIRATGIVVSFGLFGFINLIAFFLTRRYYHGKGKKLLLTIFVISLFLSFSYKTIGTFLLLLFLQFRNKLTFIKITVIAFIIALVTIPSTLANMGGDLLLRIQQYITEGNSARSESYRVMLSELANFNFFGRGIGSFGGPASITYKSPFYDEVGFNWYETPHLKTTDTFYPHLFVELGLVGALIYLLLIISPVLLLKWNKKEYQIVLIIYFSLLFDSLFSYSFNNLAFLMASLAFVYPILSYEKKEQSVSL